MKSSKSKTLFQTARNLGQAIALTCVFTQAQPLWADQAVSYEYDDQGHILKEDGPRTDLSDITTHTYNTDGTRATTTNALGHVTRYNIYDSAGRLTSVTDPNGITTDITYTPRGWVETVTVKHPTDSSLSAKTTYGYDAVGQLTRVLLPNGMATNYEYTDARQLKAIYNDLGERIEYDLDLAGNRKAETIKSASGEIKYSLGRTFDELSRVMDITGNNGQNLKTTYDVNDNPRTHTNAKQAQHSQEYDALDRVKKVIDPDLKETSYTYDAQGNIQIVTDARGNTTTYTYDAFGNLKTLVSPDTGTTQFEYDEAGNRTRKIDAAGNDSRYIYDALNRPLTVTYAANPSENVSFTYDDATPGRYGLGRVATITDSSGTTGFNYDYLGRLQQKSYSIGSQNYSQSYTYNLIGQLKQITYPSGRIVTYGYKEGRVTSVTTQASASAAAKEVITDVLYQPFGPMAKLVYANGITQEWLRDLDYRVIGIDANGKLPLDLVYHYDLADNLEEIIDNHFINLSQIFGYDSLDRLNSADGDYGKLAYTYDEVGNRISASLAKAGQNSTQTYTYPITNNRLQRITRSGSQTGTQDLATTPTATRSAAQAAKAAKPGCTTRLTVCAAPRPRAQTSATPTTPSASEYSKARPPAPSITTTTAPDKSSPSALVLG